MDNYDSFSHNNAKLETTYMPSKREWINILCYIQTIESYSKRKRKRKKGLGDICKTFNHKEKCFKKRKKNIDTCNNFVET